MFFVISSPVDGSEGFQGFTGKKNVYFG